MSSSVASFLSLSIGAPTARDRADDRRGRGEKDTGLADFFKIFTDGMMQGAMEQIRALNKPSAPAPDLSTREGIVEALARSEAALRESFLGLSGLSGSDYSKWPGDLGASDNSTFSAFQALAPSRDSILSAYKQFAPGAQASAARASESLFIEDALRIIAKGLGKPLDEVRATHLSGFDVAA
jgi:hypothetical protein